MHSVPTLSKLRSGTSCQIRILQTHLQRDGVSVSQHANMSLPIVLVVVVDGITISYLLLGVDDDRAEDGRVAQEHISTL